MIARFPAEESQERACCVGYPGPLLVITSGLPVVAAVHVRLESRVHNLENS